MTKSTVTRKAALTAGIIALDYFNMENIRPDSMGNLDYAEAIQVLVKMVEQVSKPRKAVVSKARKINENLAREIVKAMTENGTPSLTSKEIVALGLPEITTTQKAAAVMRVAEELGLASKVKEGKNIRYTIAIADDSTEDE